MGVRNRLLLLFFPVQRGKYCKPEGAEENWGSLIRLPLAIGVGLIGQDDLSKRREKRSGSAHNNKCLQGSVSIAIPPIV